MRSYFKIRNTLNNSNSNNNNNNNDINNDINTNNRRKEVEKIEKYQELEREIKRLWKQRKVQIVPVVVGALGSVTKRLRELVKKLEITLQTRFLLKTALLGTARILRKVLDI